MFVRRRSVFVVPSVVLYKGWGLYVCMHVCLYMYVCVCVYVCVYVYVFVYVYVYE